MASKKGSIFDPFFDSTFNTLRIHRRRRTNFILCALCYILYTSYFVLYSLLFDKMLRILSNSLNPPRPRPNPDRILHIINEDFAIAHVAFRGIV